MRKAVGKQHFLLPQGGASKDRSTWDYQSGPLISLCWCRKRRIRHQHNTSDCDDLQRRFLSTALLAVSLQQICTVLESLDVCIQPGIVVKALSIVEPSSWQQQSLSIFKMDLEVKLQVLKEQPQYCTVSSLTHAFAACSQHQESGHGHHKGMPIAGTGTHIKGADLLDFQHDNLKIMMEGAKSRTPRVL